MYQYRMFFLLRLAMLVILLVPALAPAAVLDIPSNGASYSGIGVITGWKCQTSGPLTIRFNGGDPIPLAYGNERSDVRNDGACTHAAVGFVSIWNWANLGDGTHTAVVYDNGVEFARSTFTVTTLGQEYVTGRLREVDMSGDAPLPVTARGLEFVTKRLSSFHANRDATPECTIPDFPAPGEEALFIWNTSTQHLELTMVRSQLWCLAARPGYDGGTTSTCAIPDFFHYYQAPDYSDNLLRHRAEDCTEAIDLYNDQVVAFWTEFFGNYSEFAPKAIADDTYTLQGQYRDKQACKAALQSLCPGALIFEGDYSTPQRREHTTAAYCTHHIYCLVSEHHPAAHGVDETNIYTCEIPSARSLAGHITDLIDIEHGLYFEDCTEAIDWYNDQPVDWKKPYTLHEQYPDKETCDAALWQLCPDGYQGEGAGGERISCPELQVWGLP